MGKRKSSFIFILFICFVLSSCVGSGTNARKSGDDSTLKTVTNQLPEDINNGQTNTTPSPPITTPPAPNPSIPGVDPLVFQAWHLENTGQSSFSSTSGIVGEDINQNQTYDEGIRGDNIRIAISDNGVEVSHEDLSVNHLPNESRNYSSASSINWAAGGDPTPTENEGINAHGTAVAGLIAAAGENSLGSRGVAPNARFAAFKYVGTSSSISKDIDQANGNFDIFNFSYGRNSCSFVDLPDALIAQLRYGVTALRNGLGALYVKAAGNEYRSLRQDCALNANGSYYGNANLEEDNSSGFVLVVGATNANGVSAGYSTPGSSLWISAPGGEFGVNQPAMVTTDLMGCDRGLAASANALNDFDGGGDSLNQTCNYTSTMNGTSSATPIISGALALLLQANPNLTWRDARFILAKTARKIDPERGPSSHPDGFDLPGHIYQMGWQTNGAGFNFHNWYGFGIVDVDAAVNMAKAYLTDLGAFQESGFADDSGELSIDIPDNLASGIEDSLNVSTNLKVESVQLKITVDHTFAGDLGIELTSPAGTKSQLMYINSHILEASLNDVLLLSNAFYGERSVGTWKLKVIDGAEEDAGALRNWKLNFQGHDLIAPNVAQAATSSIGLGEDKDASEINEKLISTKGQISLGQNFSLVHSTSIGKRKIASLAKTKKNNLNLFLHQLDGQLIWKEEVKGKAINEILVDKSHNMYFLENFQNKIYLVKKTSQGETLWRSPWKEENLNLDPHKLSLDSKGNIFLIGSFKGEEQVGYLLSKYNSEGELLWNHPRIFEEKELPLIRSLKIANSMLYIFGDYTSMKKSKDVFLDLIKEKTFERQSKSFGTQKAEKAGDMLITKNEDIILSLETEGSLGEPSGGLKDLAIIKLNKGLEILWTKQLGAKTIGVGAAGNELAGKLLLDPVEGDFYLAGSTEDNFAEVNSGGKDIFIARISQKGEVKWISQAGFKTFKERVAGNEIIKSISFIGERLFLVGETDGDFQKENTLGQKDIIFMTIDKQGRIIP